MLSRSFCQAAITKSGELDEEAMHGGSEGIPNASESVPVISWKSSTLLHSRCIMKASLVEGFSLLNKVFDRRARSVVCIEMTGEIRSSLFY